MKKKISYTLGFAFVLFYSFTIISFSQQEGEKIEAQNEIKKIDSCRYQLGNLIINSKDGEVTIPGSVNMKKGMIELLACAKGGKVHESVIVLDFIPYHLHVALLLLGLNPGGGLKFQGDPQTPKGDSVEVYVKWKYGEQDTMVRGEDLVWDIQKKKTMQHTTWVFTGSKIVNGIYQADIDKSIITTYHDPLTIIDNPLSTGGNDEIYCVNEQLVPTKGTPVQVIIKKIYCKNE